MGGEMRVLLSTHGGRGDVEPLVGLAVRLRALGAEVRVCAPPDGCAIVSRGWADLALIDDGDDCFGVGEVNQQAPFRRVAALCTTAGVVPQMADQPYWAGRVAELGIGAAHNGPTPTTESMSASLKTTLTPESRARATTVAATIRTDGPTVAAPLLLDAFSRERPPVSA
jgi:vancomycin aglycone glucosyltransferase